MEIRHNVYDDHCVKVIKYGVISGPYFPVFGLNTRKYGPEITPYSDTFHAVDVRMTFIHRYSETLEQLAMIIRLTSN